MKPVYVQADIEIYEYFKAQGMKIESPPELFAGHYGCYLYQGREEEPILAIAPYKGRIPSGSDWPSSASCRKTPHFKYL